MGHGIGECFEFLVGPFELGGALYNAAFEVAVEFLDLRKHEIEGVCQRAHFILFQFGGADRIIPALGNGLGGFSEGQNWARDLPLERAGKEVSEQKGSDDYQKNNCRVKAEPLVNRASVAFEIQSA